MARQDLLTGLQSTGARMTRQRRAVLQVLQESDEHLDAAAVYDQVRARDPRISLATVYRTLALLKREGLVNEHRLGQSHAHFEAAPRSPHYHFSCLGCGRVIEFDAPEVARVVRRLAEEQGVRVRETHLSITGYCAACRSAQGLGEERCGSANG